MKRWIKYKIFNELMKTFPDKLRPENRDRFVTEYRFNRELCKMRQRIVDYLYSGDNKGFDLKSSTDSNGLYEYSTINPEVVDAVCKELQTLGWNTEFAYGETTLFIFKERSELPLMSDMEEIDS